MEISLVVVVLKFLCAGHSCHGGDHKVTTDCPHLLSAELKAENMRIFSTVSIMDWEQGLSLGAVASASIRRTKGLAAVPMGAAVPMAMSRKADQPQNETEEILQLREETVKLDLTEAHKVIYHVEKLNLGELWDV